MGRMPESQLVTSVLLPMMSALLAMHVSGFIHRDIKPENTLFAANRVLKLAGGLGACWEVVYGVCVCVWMKVSLLVAAVAVAAFQVLSFKCRHQTSTHDGA